MSFGKGPAPRYETPAVMDPGGGDSDLKGGGERTREEIEQKFEEDTARDAKWEFLNQRRTTSSPRQWTTRASNAETYRIKEESEERPWGTDLVRSRLDIYRCVILVLTLRAATYRVAIIIATLSSFSPFLVFILRLFEIRTHSAS